MHRASLRTVWLYPVLTLLWLGIAAWLYQEQKQQQRQDKESLRAQGRVLVETVASSIRSQSRMAMYQPERLQAILEEVAASPGVLALALFDSGGKTVAAVGKVEKLAQSPDPGSLENWTKDSLQVWSPVIIGQVPWHQSAPGPPPGPGGGGRGPGRGLGLGPGPGGPGPGGPGPGGPGPGGPLRRFRLWSPPRRGELLQRPPQESQFFLTVLLPLESLRQSASAGARLRLLVAGMSFLMVLALVLAWRGTVRSVALRSSLALAEEKNRHLYEMNIAASGLAHETKNPLNAVRMAAQTLAAATPSSAAWQEKVKLIADEVDQLDSRINEWLAFSRPREPKPKQVELQPLFDELRSLISSDADEKKARVSLDNRNAVVWADREMLRQLLFNLLLNGVQALENEGHLQLKVEDQKDANITISVEDDGVGVPPEHRDRLFAPYFTTRPDGSGLGLAICRRIALAHGWRIRYEPRSPKGSTFILEGISQADAKVTPPRKAGLAGERLAPRSRGQDAPPPLAVQSG